MGRFVADNTTLNAGSGGDVIATDDVGGVKYERVKVNFGVDGAATDVSAAAPLPVDTELSTSDLDTGAGSDPRATVGLLRAESGGATLVGSANPLPTTGPLTDTQLRAVAVPVSGTVTASGPLTDAQLRASSVPVTAALAAGVNNIGDVDVLSLPSLPAGTANIGDVDVLTVPAPLSTTGGGTEATAHRVTIANDSTGVLSVDDNGGSLTVDGSVTIGAGTANIGDVDVLTLPALVAGTAEIGKVQISDGTDVATVLPVRSLPATTEKALTTIELPTRLATYQCVTAEVAPAITIGVKELLTFFHPAAVTQDAYIVEIVVSILVTTASTTGGRTNVEVFKSTSAGTGGTNLAAADVGGGLGTSAIITNAAANVMQVKTGGGALGTALIRQGVEHATQPLGSQRFEVFKASSVGNGIILRGGSADGINIQVNRVVAHTALVDQWTASIRWVEL